MDLEKWSKEFTSTDKYVIWGCSDFAEQFIKLFNSSKKLNISYVVDSDAKKHGTFFHDVEVCSPSDLLKDDNVKVIISNTYMGTRAKIKKSLEDMGFKENKDFTYIEIAMSIFGWKILGKIVSQYVEISTTTFCTLNCKNCTAYMPYIDKRHHIDLQELKKGCDDYFEVVDYVGRFRILGGEPLVYPGIIELVEYIASRHRNKIGELCIVTNGTVDISAELLDVIIKNKVTLFISNYSKSGHKLTDKTRYERLLRLLDEHEVNYHFTDAAKWLELGNPTKSQNISESGLVERFEDCRHYCRSIVGSRLFMCATWAFAVLGDIYSEDLDMSIGEEIMDLSTIRTLEHEKRFKEWYRFDIEMQISKGYLEFCKYCNGFGSLNTELVTVGEQAEGRLI